MGRRMPLLFGHTRFYALMNAEVMTCICKSEEIAERQVQL